MNPEEIRQFYMAARLRQEPVVQAAQATMRQFGIALTQLQDYFGAASLDVTRYTEEESHILLNYRNELNANAGEIYGVQ